MEKKIYCRDCKHCKDDSIVPYRKYCTHPEVMGFVDEAYEREEMAPRIEEINEYNSCKLFEESIWCKLRRLFKRKQEQ